MELGSPRPVVRAPNDTTPLARLLPRTSLDAVVCQPGLQFFPDPAHGLSEFRRVLPPRRQHGACVIGTADKQRGLPEHRHRACGTTGCAGELRGLFSVEMLICSGSCPSDSHGSPAKPSAP